jgi:hypothetical protein
MWTLRKKRTKKLLTPVEITFFRITDNRQQKERRNFGRVENITGMNNRMPKIMLNCRPNGLRRLGRTLKSLLDEEETGLSRPNS